MLNFIFGDRLTSALGAAWELDGADGKATVLLVVTSTLLAIATGILTLVKLFI